jgi:hypothetical protein
MKFFTWVRDFKKWLGIFSDYHIWIEISYEIVEKANPDLHSYYSCLRNDQVWENATILSQVDTGLYQFTETENMRSIIYKNSTELEEYFSTLKTSN